MGVGEENDQPILTKDDAWIIGFVGEVLDFRSYTDEPSDVYLVRDRWSDRGPAGLAGHDGFWAVMAMSTKTDNLHIVCDYLAQKPMYYRTDVPAAASEIDALKPFGRLTLDEIYLAAVIKWGYCPDLERTPYLQIKHVLPGEHVVLGPEGVRSRHVVDPLASIKVRGSEAPRRLRAAIEQAVIRRVKSSDVPVSSLLSGGLDSSIVHAIASDYGDVEPYFAQVPSASGTDDEIARARAVAGRRKVTEVTLQDVDPQDALQIMQEPIDLGSLVPQVALSRVVKTPVCLTGDGADEAFGGYARAMTYDSQKSDVFQELPAWHLPRLDRVMMRNAIEVRSPFLAREVMGLALGLEYRDRRGKDILRQMFKDILPRSVIDAPKIALRTSEIARDRQAASIDMVQRFRKMSASCLG